MAPPWCWGSLPPRRSIPPNFQPQSKLPYIYRAFSARQPYQGHTQLSHLNSVYTLSVRSKPASPSLSRAGCNKITIHYSYCIAGCRGGGGGSGNGDKKTKAPLLLHIFLGGVLGVVAVHGPGLGNGALEFFGADVVDAHRRPDAALEERHALLPVAVFHGISETLRIPRVRCRTQGRSDRKNTWRREAMRVGMQVARDLLGVLRCPTLVNTNTCCPAELRVKDG